MKRRPVPAPFFVALWLAWVSGLALASPQDQSSQEHLDSGARQMLSSADVAFALEAAQGGLAQLEWGKLAASKSADPSLKAFGQQMVDDFTKINDQLAAIAKERHMTLAQVLTSDDQAALDQLNRLTGVDFDKAYASAAARQHEHAIKRFETEEKKGKDTGIRDFASQTLPQLHDHVAKLKSIQTAQQSH